MLTEYNYKEAKKNLGDVFNSVVENHIPIKIIQKYGKSVYIISEEDYESIQETFYLLKNPNNAARLLKALGNKDTVPFDSIKELNSETGIWNFSF